MDPAGVFLTAEWRDLVMLSYEIDPAVLTSRVPRGCELDAWEGRHFVSVVGFRFLRTRVLGVPVPFHRDFEEVNLRFYVRRKSEGVWRRGIVFVREIVPRWAIAWVARRAYHENYVALPMRHSIQSAPDAGPSTVAYQWRRAGAWEGLSASFRGPPRVPPESAEESFISEHYWGYSVRADGSTTEYQVEHPRWGVWSATGAAFECDVASLYGAAFVDSLAAPPSSAFVADGSPVVVRRGRRLRA